MPALSLSTLAAAVIGAIVGAVATGIVSYALLRVQLAAQIKQQVALVAEQARQAAEAERTRLLTNDRAAVVTEVSKVIARMTAFGTVGPNEDFYRDLAADWRAARNRLYQTFGEDEGALKQLVSQVEWYLREMKRAVRGDESAKDGATTASLFADGAQLIRSSAPLLRQLHPSGESSVLATEITW